MVSNLLSVIIPVHNEEKTIIEVLESLNRLELSNNFQKELIVINDYSTDNSGNIIKDYIANNKNLNIQLFENESNLGKSFSVVKGIKISNGEYVIIQDADMEYNVQDIDILLKKTINEKLDFVFGNRFHDKNKIIYASFYLGNKFLSFFSNIFVFLRTGKSIPDMEVCYKLVKGDILRDIAKSLVSKSMFGFEPEVTAKLIRYSKKLNRKVQFGIVPISYFPRTIEQGKHIRYTDGIKALLEIIRFNIF